MNWQSLTGGPNGIVEHPAAVVLRARVQGGRRNVRGFLRHSSHRRIHRLIFLYYIILVLALLTNWVDVRLRRLPIGRAWEALREDEIACRSLGINTDQHQADGVRHRRRCSAGSPARSSPRGRASSSPESFVFMESGDHPGDRRARRHGQPDRRRPGRARHDRRHRAAPRPRLLKRYSDARSSIADEYRIMLFGIAMVAIMLGGHAGSLHPTARSLRERKADRRGSGQGGARMSAGAPPCSRGRASDHAVRRPDRRRRSLVHGRARARSPR